MNPDLIRVTIPCGQAAISARVPALCVPDAKAAERFFGFFTVNIRNKNRRRAYYKAACQVRRVVRGPGTGRPGPGQAAARRGLCRGVNARRGKGWSYPRSTWVRDCGRAKKRNAGKLLCYPKLGKMADWAGKRHSL